MASSTSWWRSAAAAIRASISPSVCRTDLPGAENREGPPRMGGPFFLRILLAFYARNVYHAPDTISARSALVPTGAPKQAQRKKVGMVRVGMVRVGMGKISSVVAGVLILLAAPQAIGRAQQSLPSVVG